MTIQYFESSCQAEVSVERLFAWHEAPGAFPRLNPPFDPVKVLHHDGSIQDGANATIGIPVGPFTLPWKLVHKNYVAHHKFEDHQTAPFPAGLFKSWIHKHRFSSLGEKRSELKDSIEYEVPFGPLGNFLSKIVFDPKLKKLFRYRHRVTTRDLAVLNSYPDQSQLKKKIIIAGASGFLGTGLAAFLSCAGFEVVTLVRRSPKKKSEIFWKPENGTIDHSSLENAFAVINLAGVSVVTRWNEKTKQAILGSRIQTTTTLCTAINSLSNKPKLFLCASGVGYYGAETTESVDETSSIGSGFLAEVCRQWEGSAAHLNSEVRPIHARLGAIISPSGGALKKMLPPFFFGAGGPIGNGQRYMSWIAYDDAIYAIYHCLMTEQLSGPVNICSPQFLKNSEFTSSLAHTLSRPAIIPVPASALRIVFGEMANETILASQRVHPKKLLDSGFSFSYPTIDHALQHSLGAELTQIG